MLNFLLGVVATLAFLGIMSMLAINPRDDEEDEE